MTKSEALNTLMKMRAWRRWGKGEQNEKDRPEMPEQKEVDKAFDVCIEMLSKSSLPSNLDEAALKELQVYLPQGNGPDGICYFIAPQMLAMYKSGAEWMAGQGMTKEAVIGIATGKIIIGVSQQALDELELCPGDNVVVQIRKK